MKSSRSRLLKLLALLPIVGAALALNARTVEDYVYDEPQKQQIVKKGRTNQTLRLGNQDLKVEKAEKSETPQVVNGTEVLTGTAGTQEESTYNKAYDVVEKMPVFPGGPAALFDYIIKSIRYPKEAEENKAQGRVIVTFVVETDGSISNARVVKSVEPSLDAEALRVVSEMPAWEPGLQGGNPVRVKYTIPVSFRLEGMPVPPKVEEKAEPYIVVDGTPITADELKTINPEDIDHMDVLKGESAQKEYGEKAKNGAILIFIKNNKKE